MKTKNNLVKAKKDKDLKTAPSKSNYLNTSLNTSTQVFSINAITLDQIQQK